MTRLLVTTVLLVSTLLAASCSVWVDNKLRRRPPPDEDGGMTMTCTSDMECDDMNPCNGMEACDLMVSECRVGGPPADGSPCMLGPEPGVCLAEECVRCIRDEDCNDRFSCNGLETCNIASHTCRSGTLPPERTPCMTPTVGVGLCMSGQCCDMMMCCDANDTCMPAM